MFVLIFFENLEKEKKNGAVHLPGVGSCLTLTLSII
jgi:hypothetical protein